MQDTLEKAVVHWNKVAPVLETPKTREDYDVLVGHLRDTLALVENRPHSPLTGLIKAMSRAAQEYERTHLLEQQGSALSALKYLIKINGMKQTELKEIGSQGVVSEVLNGKRSLTLRHVRVLARKFNVSPSTFIDA